MPRRIAAIAASGCLVGGLGLLSPALGLWSPSASAQPPFTGGNIPICHRTAAVTNPYIQQSPSINSIIGSNGHISHTGPIFPETGPDGFWGDIIPPIVPGLPNGLNWTPTGIAIWEAGCDVDLNSEPPPPPPTTTVPGETTTTVAGETTTTVPGETTTTVAGETTTTVPGETTTTVPGPGSPPPTEDPGPEPSPFPTDPPGGSETLPPIHAEVVDPGGTVVDVGTLDPSESAQLENELDQGVTNDADGDGTDSVPGGTGAPTGKPFGAEEIAGTALAAGGAGGLLFLRRRRNKA